MYKTALLKQLKQPHIFPSAYECLLHIDSSGGIPPLFFQKTCRALIEVHPSSWVGDRTPWTTFLHKTKTKCSLIKLVSMLINLKFTLYQT